jgi:chorismate mutase
MSTQSILNTGQGPLKPAKKSGLTIVHTLPSEERLEGSDELENIRAEIDGVDEEILFLLSKRFSLTEEVGQIKAKLGLHALDEGREAKQFKHLKKLAQDLDLPPHLEKDLWTTIMAASKARHTEISGHSW